MIGAPPFAETVQDNATFRPLAVPPNPVGGAGTVRGVDPSETTDQGPAPASFAAIATSGWVSGCRLTSIGAVSNQSSRSHSAQK